MNPKSIAAPLSTADATIALDVAKSINHTREYLLDSWQWPSPEGGFAALVNPSIKYILPEAYPPLSQLERGEAPLLAAIGYGFSWSDQLKKEESIIKSWQHGIDRLSRKAAFPLDGESFMFRPLELLGISMGILHCPSVLSQWSTWLRGNISDAIKRNIFSDGWSSSVGFLVARMFNLQWTTKVPMPFDSCDLEVSAVRLWIHQPTLSYEEISTAQTRLLQEYMELVDHPSNYAAQAIIYSQISPLIQGFISHIPLNKQNIIMNEPNKDSVPKKPSSIQHENENLKDQIDFGVITVREDEYRAVLKRFPVQIIYHGPERTYGISTVRLPDGTTYTTAIIRCMEQGTGQGQDVARDLITDLNPQWLMLVGTSGGIPHEEWTLGDVILTSRLHDFSVHALVEEKNGSRKTEFAQTGGPMNRNVQNLLASLPMRDVELGAWSSTENLGVPLPPVELGDEKFYGDSDWRSKVKSSLETHFPNSDKQREPIYKVGSTASSDALMKDSAALQQWLQETRQMLNIDMELAGVYIASRRTSRDYPILAIRGVSDIVGYRRNGAWTAFACHSAAAFARAILELRPVQPVEKWSDLLKGY